MYGSRLKEHCVLMHGCCANDTLHMYYTNAHTSKEFLQENMPNFLKQQPQLKQQT